MEQNNEPNNAKPEQNDKLNANPNQAAIVATTLGIAITILVVIWGIRTWSGSSATPTSQVEPVEVVNEDWPPTPTSPPPTNTFTPQPVNESPPSPTPITPTSTPTPTPTPTLTPTPSPTPSPTPRVLPPPGELGHLTSVELTAVTVVELEKERAFSNPTSFGPAGIIIGKDRILLEAVGKIKMGIDMKQVEESDVQVDGNSVTLILPRAFVTGVELLPGQTKIHAAEQSWLLSEFEGIESEALEQARGQLENWANTEGNLINIAERLARLQLEDFLRQLGFENIEITFKPKGGI